MNDSFNSSRLLKRWLVTFDPATNSSDKNELRSDWFNESRMKNSSCDCACGEIVIEFKCGVSSNESTQKEILLFFFKYLWKLFVRRNKVIGFYKFSMPPATMHQTSQWMNTNNRNIALHHVSVISHWSLTMIFFFLFKRLKLIIRYWFCVNAISFHSVPLIQEIDRYSPKKNSIGKHFQYLTNRIHIFVYIKKWCVQMPSAAKIFFSRFLGADFENLK